MKRSAPLKRTTRVKPKRATKRRSSREHDLEYMKRVRELPCVAIEFCMTLLGIYPCCAGPRHAHHMGERGYGQKCSDYETVSFCSEHHEEWHGCRGLFEGWSKEKRREFAQATIEATQAELGRLK